MPNQKEVEPRYGQAHFKAEDRDNKLQTLVTGFSNNNSESLKIHQDAKLSRIDLDENKSFTYNLTDERNGVYTMIISGTTEIEDTVLENRDAIGISEASSFKINTKTRTELLFIEVPMF